MQQSAPEIPEEGFKGEIGKYRQEVGMGMGLDTNEMRSIRIITRDGALAAVITDGTNTGVDSPDNWEC